MTTNEATIQRNIEADLDGIARFYAEQAASDKARKIRRKPAMAYFAPVITFKFDSK